jgi:hypothetical protein
LLQFCFNFAYKVNLRRYTEELRVKAAPNEFKLEAAGTAEMEDGIKVGRCKSTLDRNQVDPMLKPG